MNTANWTGATRKRILVAAINYAPELIGCGKYTTELCEFLASRGHEVTVVTAPPHYPGWRVLPPYKSWAYAAEQINGVRVIRCPLLAKGGGRGPWRLIGPISFGVSAVPVLIWRILRDRPDAVFCIEPTLFSAPIALLFSRLRGARTMLHVQDLELDAAFGVGYLRGKQLRKAGLWLERLLLRRFDRIITVSDKMRTALIGKGLGPASVEVLRNWVDVEAIAPLPKAKTDAFRAEFGIPRKAFVVLYAGHIGAKQALHVVFDAANRLSNNNNIMFVVAGDGPHKELLQNQYKHLVNVIYLPLQPLSRLNGLLNCANIHVLPQHRDAADLVLPSKLGGMLASGRPIVVAADVGTELFNMLSGIATIVPPEDDRALAQAINQLQTRDVSAKVRDGVELARTMSASSVLAMFEQALVGGQ